MIHTEAWHREADSLEKELEGLQRKQLDAMTEYVRLLARSGKLKDYPHKSLAALAHFGVLRGMDLRGAYLNRVDLSKCDLRGTDLSGVDLRGADLTEADLRGATLKKTSLSQARLYLTNFEGANLQGAFLQDAEFGNTRMEGADIRGAHYDWEDLEKMEGEPISGYASEDQ